MSRDGSVCIRCLLAQLHEVSDCEDRPRRHSDELGEMYFPEKGSRVIDLCMGQVLQKMSTSGFQRKDALPT